MKKYMYRKIWSAKVYSIINKMQDVNKNKGVGEVYEWVCLIPSQMYENENQVGKVMTNYLNIQLYQGNYRLYSTQWNAK